MKKNTFQPYNPDKLYDIILLLAGENIPDLHKGWKSMDWDEIEKNPNYYPRSKGAIQVFNKGKIGGILVTGGQWGLADKEPTETDGKVCARYLTLQGMRPAKVYVDERPHETLGSLAIPATTPLVGNPDFDSLESILLITEKGHMKRALKSAALAVPANKMDYLAVPGPYRPGIITKAYELALHRALRKVKEPDPYYIQTFLAFEHPFYGEGWFNKPIPQRKQELAIACIKWLVS